MTAVNLLLDRRIPVIKCSQHDTSLRLFSFCIYDGDDRWTIDADSVELECSNGAVVECDVEDNTAVADCTEELSGKAGRFTCKLKFTKDDTVIHSQRILLWVEGEREW